MIRGVSRRLRTLSLRQYMVVLVTVLIPMLVSSILDLSMGWVWLMLAGWCLASVLIMAEVFREERADVNQRIAEKVDEVLDQLRDLETKSEESAAIITGLEGHINQVEEVMRSAFEGIGVDLPARRYELRASVSSLGIVTGKAALQVRGGSRKARIWRWFKSKSKRFWNLIWRIVVGEAA